MLITMKTLILITLTKMLYLVLLHAACSVVNAADFSCSDPVQQKGISLCERKISGSAFIEIRAETQFCTGKEDLLQVLTDVSGFETWIPSVLEAKLLSNSGNSWIYYIKYGAPWPFKPRDMVYLLSNVTNLHDETTHVTVEGLPVYIETSKTAVRLQAAQGSWRFFDRGDTLKVIYTMHVEPGKVPAALANSRTRSTTIKTLTNLRDRFPCH